MIAYDTLRIGNVNTPRIATACIVVGMGDQRAERLRKARERAGFESAAEATRRFGWSEPAYRHHENGTRSYGPDAAKKYGRAFKVKAGWLLGIDGIDDSPVVNAGEVQDRLVVNGSVEAGVWRESRQWNDERQFTIIGQPTVPVKGKRFGLVVKGKSMDLLFEPDSVLDCVSIFDADTPPESGDVVIVERVRPDGLRELTVKEYLVENGIHYVVPRSTLPEFSGRIEVGKPDANHPDEGGVQVIAFVLAHYPPRTLNLLRRMGLILDS